MIIKSEKEYKDYEARVEKLMQRGTELGDMELLTDEEKEEFMRLSEALDEYGSAYPRRGGAGIINGKENFKR
jgi:HTH-type transcriptional regulator/antitoxin HigA